MNLNKKYQNLTLNAISITLVLLATAFINIRLPLIGNGGLIHLGNVPLFAFALLFGRKTGFIAGAIGMSLFDLLSGWTLWAPFTFLIVGSMGYVVGFIGEKEWKQPIVRDITAMLLALLIKIVGYYITEVILYGNLYAPLGSIVGNIIQVSTAIVIVIPLMIPLRKFIKKEATYKNMSVI